MELVQVVNDWRARAVGGLDTALLLWEACCVPSLLYGCGTWLEMAPSTVKKLNAIQNWFLRLIFQVGPGVPIAALCWETGVLDMELRVWMEMLMLVLHIRGLGENTLARKIYEEQKLNNWPGLIVESRTICKKLNIEDCNVTNLSKKHYRKNINKRGADLYGPAPSLAYGIHLVYFH